MAARAKRSWAPDAPKERPLGTSGKARGKKPVEPQRAKRVKGIKRRLGIRRSMSMKKTMGRERKTTERATGFRAKARACIPEIRATTSSATERAASKIKRMR